MLKEVMMSKKTAVEFLQEALSIHLTDEQKMQFEGLFQSAKGIEKNQIEIAFTNGDLFSSDYFDGVNITSENYYNETYKGGNDES